MTNNDAHHVVVDGSNIAFEGRESPSLRQLDEAVRAFMKDHPHDVLTVVVDATFAHRIDESEKDEYEAGIENGELVTPPAGAVGRGDAFVLEIAERTNATVLSNDSFQEFHGEHPWLFDDGRLIGGKPIQDVGWVFVARTPVRGPASRRAVQEAKKADRDGGAGGGGGGGGRTDGGRSSGRRGGGRSQPGSGGGRRPRRRLQRGLRRTDRPKWRRERPPTGQRRQRRGQRQWRRPVGLGRTRSRVQRRAGRQAAGPPAHPELSGDFAKFVEQHPLGSTVTGTVSSFASHGAHVDIDGVRCYLPLVGHGRPAPQRCPRGASARARSCR